MQKKVPALFSVTCLVALSATGFYLTLGSDFDQNPLAPVFIDTFQNGLLSNSDTEMNIWTATLPQTSTADETAGTLVLSASAPDTRGVPAILTTPVQSRFNFFDQQLHFGTDLTLSGINPGGASGLNGRGRLMLSSTGGTGYSAPDVLMIGGRFGNYLTIAYKLDAPSLDPDDPSSGAITFLANDPGDNKLNLGEAVGQLKRLDLTINATRFKAIATGAGRLSQRTRVTGLHGIDRTLWGSQGDSAFTLETLRTAGSPSNSSFVGTWDNVQVEADTEPLLAEHFIEFQASYPASSSTSKVTGNFRLWIPSTEPVIRGVVLLGPGSSGDGREYVPDLVAQEGARALGFALIGYPNTNNLNFWSGNPTKIRQSVQALLDAAATVSGHPELRNAPLCITGFSAGAFDSAYLANHWPERTIAFAAHRGGAYPFLPLSEATKNVPGVFIAGSFDDNGATNPSALRQIFTNWRNAGARVGFAVDWRAYHNVGGNQGWEFAWSWLVETATLRYPRPMAPSTDPADGPPQLLDLNDADAWLADTATFTAGTTPIVTSLFTSISPFASYTNSINQASWIPNETLARAYRAFSSTDLKARSLVPLQGALRITSPVQYADPVFVGKSCTITVDPREFGNTNTITQIQFYHGDALIATDTAAPWSQDFTPSEPGLYTLSAVATASSGEQRDAFRILHVIPEHFSPLAFSQAVTVTTGQISSGNVTGIDPEGRPLTFVLQQNPSHGQLTVFNMNTGAYTYEPAAGFTGNDTFSFASVCGGTTGTVATVTFTIIPAP